MTENLAARESSTAEQHFLRDWRSAIFAPVGSGQRRRRGSDGVRLAAAVLALVCCLLVIRYDSRVDRAITQVIHPPPRSITWLVTVVYQAGFVRRRDRPGGAGPARAPVGDRARHRAERGRDGGGVRDPDRAARQPRRPADRNRDRRLRTLRFPVVQVAVFAAVATAALPYLARGVQRLIEIFIALVALACAVGGHGLPLNVAGSLAIGWGADGDSPAGLRLTARPAVRRMTCGYCWRNSASARATCARRPGRSGGWPSSRPPRYAEAGRADRLAVAVYGRDAADAQAAHQGGPVRALP